jgi:hypothetical protein
MYHRGEVTGHWAYQGVVVTAARLQTQVLSLCTQT